MIGNPDLDKRRCERDVTETRDPDPCRRSSIKLADDRLEFSYISRGTETCRLILGACRKDPRRMLRAPREQRY
jgi:hypothetical protein